MARAAEPAETGLRVLDRPKKDASARVATRAGVVAARLPADTTPGCGACVFNVDDVVCANGGYPRRCPLLRSARDDSLP